jgi:hypothetical protein
MGYRKGEFKETLIKTVYNDQNMRISIEPSEGAFEGMVQNRTWVIQINQVTNVKGILVNGKNVDFEIHKTKNLIELKTLKKTNETFNIDVLFQD